ncbi:hypothetical protein [Labrenzia sp. PHM005]|uniref:hypothetical protein n=1 Tax=Labrenzia sp. PHM005 TaxID=2590016 RepID=UPI00113FE971|nr:hypothetical protein [Labrenzia sp. PHM005]QDG74800.1 hypothetical protein FJ695_02360 [Labrenzia sp. PHM005]
MTDQLSPQKSKFETYQTAKTRLKKIQSRLTKLDDLSPDLKKLLSCKPGDRCNTEACPVCLRQFRKQLPLEAVRLGISDGDWTAASIIPADMVYPKGKLRDADLKAIRKRVSKWMDRSKLSDKVVIGGIDISFNTRSNVPIGWQLHLYLLIKAPCTEELKQQIRKAFPASIEAPRPYRIKAVASGSFKRVLTYSYKSGFYCRSQFEKSDWLKRDGTPRVKTRSLSLKSEQELELLGWLAEHAIGSRLILRNLRRATPPGCKNLRFSPTAPLGKLDDGLSPRSKGRKRRR